MNLHLAEKNKNIENRNKSKALIKMKGFLSVFFIIVKGGMPIESFA